MRFKGWPESLPKPYKLSGSISGLMPVEICYCGEKMVEMQTCKYQCPNCGALLDCEDVSGLPK
jgi:hypothetical protein